MVLLEDFPIQRVYSLEANDPAKYLQAFKKYNSKYNKADRLILTGGFSAGIDRTYGNTWIVQSFKDFKGALEVMQNCHPNTVLKNMKADGK